MAEEDAAQLTCALPSPSPPALSFPLHFLSPRVPFCSGSSSRRLVPWPGSWCLFLSRGSSSLQHFPLRAAACWHRHSLRSNITCGDSPCVQFCEKLSPNMSSEPFKKRSLPELVFLVVVVVLFCFLSQGLCLQYSQLVHILGRKERGTGSATHPVSALSWG